jgi:hypothetical protein
MTEKDGAASVALVAEELLNGQALAPRLRRHGVLKILAFVRVTANQRARTSKNNCDFFGCIALPNAADGGARRLEAGGLPLASTHR